MQGLVPTPATLAGRGFLFHAEAATDEVGGFSWKPWPWCAQSSPATKGGQITEPWWGRVMFPAPPPSPVPTPLLGQPTPAGTLGCLPWDDMEELGWGAPGFAFYFVGWFWASAAATTVHGWKWTGLVCSASPAICLWVFFLGKAKPTSCFGAGYRVGGKGVAWSSVS